MCVLEFTYLFNLQDDILFVTMDIMTTSFPVFLNLSNYCANVHKGKRTLRDSKDNSWKLVVSNYVFLYFDLAQFNT